MKKILFRPFYTEVKLSDGTASYKDFVETSDIKTVRYWVTKGLAEAKPVGEPVRPNSEADLIIQICDAIEKLDQENDDMWTTSGKPQVRELEAILGYDISADERDQAWQEFEVK